MVAAAQIREMGRRRESCACMMEVKKQAQDGKAPHGRREWRRMQLQGTSEEAQSVRENIFRLWLVFQRKRERKEKTVAFEALQGYITVPQVAAQRRDFWETGMHCLIKGIVIPHIVLTFLQVISFGVGSWTSDGQVQLDQSSGSRANSRHISSGVRNSSLLLGVAKLTSLYCHGNGKGGSTLITRKGFIFEGFVFSGL